MDELGKLLQELAKAAPADGAQTAPETAPEAAPAAAAPDLSAILGALPMPGGQENRKVRLLSALKPYLRPARQEKLERAQALLGTAYTVRGLLSSLGGVLHV